MAKLVFDLEEAFEVKRFNKSWAASGAGDLSGSAILPTGYTPIAWGYYWGGGSNNKISFDYIYPSSTAVNFYAWVEGAGSLEIWVVGAKNIKDTGDAAL